MCGRVLFQKMDNIWVSETVLWAHLFLSIKFTSLSINLSLAFSLVVFAWKTVFCLSCCCLQSITLPTQKKKTHAKKTPFYVSTLNSQLHMCRKAPKKTFHTPPYVSPSVCVCLCGRFRFHPPDINRIFPKGAKPRTHRCLRYSSTTAAFMCVRFCWDLWEGEGEVWENNDGTCTLKQVSRSFQPGRGRRFRTPSTRAVLSNTIPLTVRWFRLARVCVCAYSSSSSKKTKM